MQVIRTALCSFGTSGRYFHAPFLQAHSGFSLVGAWERNHNLLHKIYPKAKSYDSLEELLQDDIDLVIVNTPTHCHYTHAKEALLADKHVVVEKAFTTTFKEAEALQFLANAQDLFLTVYQNRRYDSDFKTVKQVIQQGLVGEVIEAEFSFYKHKPLLSPKQHKEDGSLGSGLLYDLGVHLIDQALHLFGMPTEINATLLKQRPQTLVDDFMELTLYYSFGLVKLKGAFMPIHQAYAYIVHGTNASFVKPRGDVQEQLLLKNKKPNMAAWANETKDTYGTLYTQKNDKLVSKTIASAVGNYMNFYDSLYNTFTQQSPLPVTVTEAIQVMQVVEAAQKSNEQKKRIVL